MLVIEFVSKVPHYGVISHGYYLDSAVGRTCSDIFSATRFDKVEVDTFINSLEFKQRFRHHRYRLVTLPKED